MLRAVLLSALIAYGSRRYRDGSCRGSRPCLAVPAARGLEWRGCTRDAHPDWIQHDAVPHDEHLYAVRDWPRRYISNKGPL